MASSRKARGSARHAQQDPQQRALHDRWAQQHPALAREERSIRKALKAQNDNFGHKRNGTVETLAKASQVRQGALARLHVSGAINNEQLFAATEIHRVYERISRDAHVRTADLATRVDVTRSGDGTFFEALGAVRAEVAYTRWRGEIVRICKGIAVAAILDMIVGGVGVNEISRTHRMDKRKARRLLIEALDLWPACYRFARDEVDEATLLAAQAAIL